MIFRRILGIGIAVILLVGFVVCTFLVNDQPSAPASVRMREPLTISFGLSREKASSSILIDVCKGSRDVEDPQTLSEIENSQGECVAPPSPATGSETPTQEPNTQAAASATRPAILSTSVQSDLARCPSDDHSASFPAGQVTVTAELVGATGLRIAAVADPQTPREISEGAYCGRIVIERASGPYRTVDIVLTAQDRHRSAMVVAVYLLLLGAGAGVLIRFLNDPVPSLLGPYRRLRAIRRWFRSADLANPKPIRLLIQDIEDALWYLDSTVATQKLDLAEKIRDSPDQSAQSVIVQQALAITTDDGVADRPLSPPRFLGRLLFGIFGNYWFISLCSVVAVVVATGLWTQFFNEPSFAGSELDWVGLVVFGLAAQVTGSTVAEALGKLMPSSPPPGG